MDGGVGGGVMMDKAAFSAAAPLDSLPGGTLPWIVRLRADAFDRFAERGWPSTQLESWRFTPLGALPTTPWSAPPEVATTDQDGLLGSALVPFDAYRLVFLNGRYMARLSHPPRQALAGSIAGFLKAEPRSVEGRLGKLLNGHAEAFGALNTAYFRDGAFIRLPKDVALDRPVHALFVNRPGAAQAAVHTRLLVIAEAGASATIVEEHVGSGCYFSNPGSEFLLDERANIEHIALQRESMESFHISATEARLGRAARLRAHQLDFGGKLVRHDLNVLLDDEAAGVSLGGLYIVTGRQLVDNHTTIDHASPRGTSGELYKGVLDGHARAVFNGSIVVRPAAQKTDARVYNKNLLLSEDGLVHTKPDFRIHANDVQCKHGAAIGQISEDALFYLRARGIGPDEARRMLVRAFAAEPLAALPVPLLREALEESVVARLGRELGA